MTRSFLKRAAIAAVLLPFGFISVWGENSLYDQFIAKADAIGVAIVLAALSAFWCSFALWVCSALSLPTGGHRRRPRHGWAAATLSLVSAACLAGQPAHAWVTTNTVVKVQPIEGHFTSGGSGLTNLALTAEQQRWIDAAIADASREAKDAPGFVVTVELAIGIFIAAIVIGSVLYIVVRMVCSSLDRMKTDLSNRLGKLKVFLENPAQTNVIGAGIFRDRPATTSDLPIGKELVVGFTAPAKDEPAVLEAAIADADTISLDELLTSLGLPNSVAEDATVGKGVSRKGNGYQVAPAGFPDLVTLSFESTTNLVWSAWRNAFTLRVPTGAIIDVADLTGNSENRYWRVGVAQ